MINLTPIENTDLVAAALARNFAFANDLFHVATDYNVNQRRRMPTSAAPDLVPVHQDNVSMNCVFCLAE